MRRWIRTAPSRLAVAGIVIAATVAAVAAVGTARAQGDGADEEEFREVLDMTPDDQVGFTLRNVFAPITGLFMGGPGYYYSARELEIETTPPGGTVDIFYIRANFQKRFEQAETPVTVILPPRIEQGPRDALTIRAFAEGYRQQSVTLKANTREDKVVIDLEPLPNTLEAVSHRYFAGRSSLSFLTKERLEFRLQDSDDGFTVVLNETGRTSEASAAIEGIRDPLIEEALAQQLGEDLLVQSILRPGAKDEVEVRSRESRDAARDLYEFTLDVIPSDGGAATVERALAALAAIGPKDVTGCALDFEAELRSRLDEGSLSRALTPRGGFTDKYVRAAMRRLGEVTPGHNVRFSGGSTFDPTVPIELEAALSQAGGANGFLALLRRFVDMLEAEEYQRDTLRGLISPELDSARFAVVMDAAEQREQACTGG